MRIALIAHDDKKTSFVAWAVRHRAALARFELVATGTTGTRVMGACPELAITRLKSGPMGGDQQIGAMIAEGRVSAMIFFIDALSPHPHDVDVKALLRLAVLYDIPFACNAATADLLIAGLQVTLTQPSP
jgi:methylglyoxal synthase